MAELKFSIESTDRRAVKAPNGSGIGSREIRWTVAKFPFSPVAIDHDGTQDGEGNAGRSRIARFGREF